MFGVGSPFVASRCDTSLGVSGNPLSPAERFRQQGLIDVETTTSEPMRGACHVDPPDAVGFVVREVTCLLRVGLKPSLPSDEVSRHSARADSLCPNLKAAQLCSEGSY